MQNPKASRFSGMRSWVPRQAENLPAALQQRAGSVSAKIYSSLRSAGLSDRSASLAVYPVACMALLLLPFGVASLALVSFIIVFCFSFLLSTILCGIAFTVSSITFMLFIVLIAITFFAICTLVATAFVMLVVTTLLLTVVPLILLFRAVKRPNDIPSPHSELDSSEVVSEANTEPPIVVQTS